MKETRYKMMFVFIKKMLIGLSSACTIGSFGASLASKHQPCQTRPTLVNINSYETLFYPFTVSVNKCGGS